MAFATRLRAMMKHEIVATDVEGLLRGSGQLEDLRRQLDERRQAAEVAHPHRPWEALREVGHAEAFFWIAQAFIAIARSLKEADDADDPETAGYMPPVSHDQAMALLRQAGTYLALSHAALADPSANGSATLPVALPPRIEMDGRCPVAHLKGMLTAAQYLENYAQVDVDRASAAATDAAPEEVKVAARRLRGEVAAARSHLAMATGAVYPILNGERVDDITHEEAETNLWRALETYTWLGQVVALPSLLSAPSGQDGAAVPPRSGAGHTPPPVAGPRRIGRDERWRLTDGTARQRLSVEGRTAWAEDELNELWGNKNWTLSAEEQRFLAETEALQRQGQIRATSYMAECPFDPIWTATRPMTILGRSIGLGGQFAYNHHAGKGELLTTFRSVPDFEECAEDND